MLVSANVVPSSPILLTLMMEAIRSSEIPLLEEPHGVSSKKMAFFKLKYNFNHNNGIM
jgi:hypothetical protein